MIGNFDISKTLKMLHEAAQFELESRNYQKGIDILNDARIIESKMGFKNQSAESILEIANAYYQLRNYDLALWFTQEAIEILSKTSKTSLQTKAYILLEEIKALNYCDSVAN